MHLLKHYYGPFHVAGIVLLRALNWLVTSVSERECLGTNSTVITYTHGQIGETFCLSGDLSLSKLHGYHARSSDVCQAGMVCTALTLWWLVM